MHRFSETASSHKEFPDILPISGAIMYKSNLINAFPTELTAADGTIVRLCPLDLTKGKPIYCSRKGDFYAYRDNRLHWRKPDIVLHYNRITCHTRYPKIHSDLGGKSLHLLFALTWLGPKPGPDYVVYHLNVIILDWSADNLQWTTISENNWRANHVLRVLRIKNFNLTAFKGDEMKKWFAIFRALEMTERKPIELSHDDLVAFFCGFRLVDPQEQMEYELTHHMEC